MRIKNGYTKRDDGSIIYKGQRYLTASGFARETGVSIRWVFNNIGSGFLDYIVVPHQSTGFKRKYIPLSEAGKAKKVKSVKKGSPIRDEKELRKRMGDARALQTRGRRGYKRDGIVARVVGDDEEIDADFEGDLKYISSVDLQIGELVKGYLVGGHQTRVDTEIVHLLASDLREFGGEAETMKEFLRVFSGLPKRKDRAHHNNYIREIYRVFKEAGSKKKVIVAGLIERYSKISGRDEDLRESHSEYR